MPGSVGRLTVADRGDVVDAAVRETVDLAREYIAEDGTGRVALIVPEELRPSTRQALSRGMRQAFGSRRATRLEGQDPWDAQLPVCSTEEVKGLEYDAVVVVEPGLICQEAPSPATAAADLYVAMTRPTQRLVIVRTTMDERLLDL